jgi:hypothetical protein
MGFRDMLEANAVKVSEGARRAAASAPGQLAGESLRGLRAMLDEGDEEMPGPERFLLTLVQAVRDEDDEEDRGARDVYVAARKRRRRLALLSLGTGPFAGVANQIADLYCETATVCDVADLHGLALSDEDIAAHMLVLWEITDEHQVALEAVRGDPPLSRLLGTRLWERAEERLPERLTKGSLTKALWNVRGAATDARKDVVKTALFTGHRTKKVIREAEAQLGVNGSRRSE